jgi:enhancing lycopene biosynthesis protein 2
MSRVGVLLSGCGFQDGSEVYEAVISLLALEKGGAQIQVMAPDVEQAHVINHYRGEESRRDAETRGEGRNVLTESARIVRGQIISVNEVSAHELDALVIIGGWGVVKNLCTFINDGARATVNPNIERLIHEMNALGKPIGAMCAGPILVALALRDKNISITIGNDAATIAQLSELGATHVVAAPDEIHIDEANSIVTTPAFMIAQTPAQAEPGINALVAEVLRRAQALTVGMPAGGEGNTVPGVTPHVH